MLAVRKITLPDFDDVHDELLVEVDPTIPRQRWRLAFENYASEEEHCGYVLMDGTRLVGVLGTIFSERKTSHSVSRFCNIHCWYVKEEYRPRSLLLMQPVLGLKHHTLTDLTPSIRVIAIAKRLGFQTLDRSAIILPRLFAFGNSDAEIEDLSESTAPPGGLEPHHWQLHCDHRAADCGGVWIRDREQYCYVLYSKIDRHRWPYCLLHCVTNPMLLAKHHGAFRSHVLSKTCSRYIAIDSRLVAGVRIPASFRIRSNEQLYRPHKNEPTDVDSLYSELVFLKHSIFPGLHQRLRYALKRCLPTKLQKYFRPS